ncbi:hypothetical protein, partial [Cronobacter sakazakii]|uniref:hypothetical protein n=1 Tax=Cronobacter sakazakii TaxID=28141 RepID=UPI001319D9C1
KRLSKTAGKPRRRGSQLVREAGETMKEVVGAVIGGERDQSAYRKLPANRVDAARSWCAKRAKP